MAGAFQGSGEAARRSATHPRGHTPLVHTPAGRRRYPRSRRVVYTSLMRLRVPSPVSGGLMLTYTCNAACGHCMYACSPRWPADWISDQDLEETLRSLAGKIQPGPYGPDSMGLNHGLHFSGGEPFLNFELLCRAAGLARELGIPSLFVETNCSWARGDAETRQRLLTLRKQGIIGIMISINPFYLEHVPFERSERAIRISQEVFGTNVAVYQLEYYRLFKQLGIRGRLSFAEFLELTGGRNFAAASEFFLSGRAPYSVESTGLFPHHPAAAFLSEPCAPSFIRSWHNHFDNYNNFMPGYCGGISLGDCRNLDRIITEGVDLDERPVLAAIASGDFAGLLDMARGLGYAEREAGYLSKCHLCVEVRRHLASSGDFPELAPKEFYLRLEEAVAGPRENSG